MDGDDPPPPMKPLSVKLLEEDIYVFGRSLKYARPRGLRNLTWWGSERVEFINGYNFNPNMMDEGQLREVRTAESTGLKSKILWIFRKNFGAGFYHKPIFRNRLIWRIFTKNINRFLPHPYPDMSQGPVETYPLQINLHCDILIVGGGLAGLKTAEEFAKHDLNIVVMEGDKYSTGGFASVLDGYSEKIYKLHNMLRRKGVKILGGTVFQGFLEDVYLAYKYDTNQTILVNADRIIIATGIYEVPPLFENNDLPMIISLTTLLKLSYKYRHRFDRNGVIISGMGDLIPALNTLLKMGLKPIVIFRNKAPTKLREYLEENGFQYYEEVECLRAYGSTRVEKIKLMHSNGEAEEFRNLSFMAYSAIVTPDKEVTAQLNIPHVFDTRLGGYIPLHSIYGKLPVEDIEVYVVGGAGGFLPIDTVEDYSVGIARYILGSEEDGEDYEGVLNSILEKLRREYKEVYDGLLALDKAYRDMLTYEFVGWEKPPNKFEGDEAKIFVCFDTDTLYSDLVHAYRKLNMWRMEHVKRYTGLGTGVCQGRDCQLNASIILHELSGHKFLDIGRFRARFPVTPQSLLSLGGVEA